MGGDPSYYSAYGLTVRSDVPLPELRSVDDGGPPDVVVRVGDAEALRASLDDDAAVTSIEFESLGTLVVAEGREVVFDLHAPELSRTKFFRRTVENQGLALALLQRGLLVVHASAVVVDDRAVVFVGPRGAGKSTTAAAFHLQGYPVIADDIVGIRVDEDPPTVVPGVPQLRLDPDVVAALGVDGTTRPDHDAGPDKRYRQLDPVREPLPLGCVYVLEEGESLGVESLAGPDQFFRFVEHTYRRGYLSGEDMTPTGFEQCAAVVESTPVRLLRRPKRHDVLTSLVELVARDVGSTERETTVN
jgi:hypothetical protein